MSRSLSDKGVKSAGYENLMPSVRDVASHGIHDDGSLRSFDFASIHKASISSSEELAGDFPAFGKAAFDVMETPFEF